MKKDLFTKILFWVELIALPFIFLAVWSITTEVVTETREIVGIEIHEEAHHNNEVKHENGKPNHTEEKEIHKHSDKFFTVDRFIALILVVLAVLIWNKTRLHNYIPCSAHGHTINVRTLATASTLFVVHLSFDHHLASNDSLINQIAFYAHRLTDVFVLILLIINWSRIVGGLLKPALILTSLTVVFSFLLQIDIHEIPGGDISHLIIAGLLAFFLASFLHKPGNHKHSSKN